MYTSDTINWDLEQTKNTKPHMTYIKMTLRIESLNGTGKSHSANYYTIFLGFFPDEEHFTVDIYYDYNGVLAAHTGLLTVVETDGTE